MVAPPKWLWVFLFLVYQASSLSFVNTVNAAARRAADGRISMAGILDAVTPAIRQAGSSDARKLDSLPLDVLGEVLEFLPMHEYPQLYSASKRLFSSQERRPLYRLGSYARDLPGVTTALSSRAARARRLEVESISSELSKKHGVGKRRSNVIQYFRTAEHGGIQDRKTQRYFKQLERGTSIEALVREMGEREKTLYIQVSNILDPYLLKPKNMQAFIIGRHLSRRGAGVFKKNVDLWKRVQAQRKKEMRAQKAFFFAQTQSAQSRIAALFSHDRSKALDDVVEATYDAALATERAMGNVSHETMHAARRVVAFLNSGKVHVGKKEGLAFKRNYERTRAFYRALAAGESLAEANYQKAATDIFEAFHNTGGHYIPDSEAHKALFRSLNDVYDIPEVLKERLEDHFWAELQDRYHGRRVFGSFHHQHTASWPTPVHDVDAVVGVPQIASEIQIAAQKSLHPRRRKTTPKFHIPYRAYLESLDAFYEGVDAGRSGVSGAHLARAREELRLLKEYGGSLYDQAFVHGDIAYYKAQLRRKSEDASRLAQAKETQKHLRRSGATAAEHAHLHADRQYFKKAVSHSGRDEWTRHYHYFGRNVEYNRYYRMLGGKLSEVEWAQHEGFLEYQRVFGEHLRAPVSPAYHDAVKNQYTRSGAARKKPWFFTEDPHRAASSAELKIYDEALRSPRALKLGTSDSYRVAAKGAHNETEYAVLQQKLAEQTDKWGAQQNAERAARNTKGSLRERLLREKEKLLEERRRIDAKLRRESEALMEEFDAISASYREREARRDAKDMAKKALKDVKKATGAAGGN